MSGLNHLILTLSISTISTGNFMACLSYYGSMGHYQNKSIMLFSLLEDELGPGVANTPQELSLIWVTILVLITQGSQIWSRYPRMRHRLVVNTVCPHKNVPTFDALFPNSNYYNTRDFRFPCLSRRVQFIWYFT